MKVRELIIKLLEFEPDEDVYVDENLLVSDVESFDDGINLLTESADEE